MTAMECEFDNLELRSLILGKLDNNLSTEQEKQFQDIVNSSLEAQRYYTEYVMLCAAIKQYVSSSVMVDVPDSAGVDEGMLEFLADSESNAPTVEQEQKPQPVVEKSVKRVSRPGRNIANRILGFIALAAVMAFLVHVYNVYAYTPVARVTDIMNCTLLSGSSEVTVGSVLCRSNGRMSLGRGYVELECDSARVVLEAPCEFSCSGIDHIQLYSGCAYVAMNEGHTGFVVDTPVSRVLDLGTEFGVKVCPDSSTEVHVIKGETRVTAKNSTQTSGHVFNAGFAGNIDSSGRQVTNVEFEVHKFVRAIDSASNTISYGPRSISITDITAGGNGKMEYCTEKWLCPGKGYVNSPYDSGSDYLFKTMPENKYVDGTFVPGSKSTTLQVVSSDGDVFDNCPVTCGEFYVNIGVCPESSSIGRDGDRNGIINFNGTNYNSGGKECILLHANIGITYDLGAIVADYPFQNVSSFHAYAGIADFNEDAPCNADIWVLVDGKVRYSLKN